MAAARTSATWIVFVFICAAVGTLRVSGAQTPEADETLRNPVISTNFPDPFILEVDDVYYAYSTGSSSRNVPVATSTDLVRWTIGRDVLPALPRWVNLNRPDVWAPEVLEIDGQYRLYYTARDRASGKQCIGLATSDLPGGPFRDPSEAPFICQSNVGGSIDPSPFRDQDGTLYLYWKNDGNCCMMATYVYVQELSPDGTTLVGEPIQLVRNDEGWEGPVVEAPTMWLNDGSYYLFFSGNVYSSEAYAIGYALCAAAVGPCEDAPENPILSSDLESRPLVLGPGHQTLLMDDAGDTWLFYHVWQVTDGGILTRTRQVWMDRLIWIDDRPTIQGPTREVQPAPDTDD
ncbi:MAG: glycoside hydrolase family 43 protein [Chloroflexota bacterium]|nr:glycoside hydrolase family 43 protein [Chloroflexota bacterium]